jgi:hypothetical protein
MARGSVVFLILLFLVCCGSCEKDDICVDGDTPLLVIRFYDIQDTTVLKAATDLRVYGVGQTSTVNTFSDRSSTDSIAIPLRITAEETEFVFILDSAGDDGEETGNLDTLRFSYEPDEVFISRACGYVVQFDSLQATQPADNNLWIQDIRIANPNVVNQASAHVKIFH